MQFNRCLGCMEEISGYPCPNCGFDPRVAPAFSYALPLGAVLNGHYVVGKVLGQGGFSDRRVSVHQEALAQKCINTAGGFEPPAKYLYILAFVSAMVLNLRGQP